MLDQGQKDIWEFLVRGLWPTPPEPPKRQFRVETSYCNFCGKSQNEITLIAGPCVHICRDCVFNCMDVLDINPQDNPVSLRNPK